MNLEAVFRLAEERNAPIALAREKVHESQVENDLAAKGWLPKVTAGVGYYRHEGGIQNEDGTLTRSSFGALYPGVDLHTAFDVREATFARIDAERKRWQQQGELSRISNEQLLQSAETYIDLLTARSGESVSQELEKNQRELLQRAKDLEKEGGKVLSEAAAAELAGTEQAEAKLRQQGDAASAKLSYLLGLDPESPLVPVDAALAPIDVVDATPPASALVGQALANGPGVRELQGLLSTIDCGMAELESPKKFLPTLDLCLGEGAFGAGPDASMVWDNRFDVGVEARWNLTELFKAKDEKRLAESKRRQVELSYDDLRGKLTLGVREAREAILSGREQIEQGVGADQAGQRELPAERPAAEAERAGRHAGRGAAEPARPGNGPFQLHHLRERVQQGPGPVTAAARAGGVPGGAERQVTGGADLDLGGRRDVPRSQTEFGNEGGETPAPTEKRRMRVSPDPSGIVFSFFPARPAILS